MSDWIKYAKVGDKVVCARGADVGIPECGGWAPKTGGVYTIRGFWEYTPSMFLLLLEEYVHPKLWDGVNEYGWDASRFRPVQTRPTSIAIFEKLLQSAPADQPMEELA